MWIILDGFTQGRMIGNLEEGRSVTCKVEEFEIAFSLGSISDDRDTYPKNLLVIAVAHEEPRWQITDISIGEKGHTADRRKSRKTHVSGDRYPILPFARKLHIGGLFTRLEN